jgi:hypothetical protein
MLSDEIKKILVLKKMYKQIFQTRNPLNFRFGLN